jgi:ComF family protein
VKKFWISQLLNNLFPISCINCDCPGAYLCTLCAARIPRKPKTIYSTSSIPSFAEAGLLGIHATTQYHISPILKKTIHLFKYRKIKSLAEPLGDIMRERIEPFLKQNSNQWLIIPVPLHNRKLRERGFNQNDLLADRCFRDIKTVRIAGKTDNPLQRRRATESQTRLQKNDRCANVRDCFFVNKPNIVYGKNIIVVDDVATTGATIFESARALKAIGAKNIFGFVLAYD